MYFACEGGGTRYVLTELAWQGGLDLLHESLFSLHSPLTIPHIQYPFRFKQVLAEYDCNNK